MPSIRCDDYVGALAARLYTLALSDLDVIVVLPWGGRREAHCPLLPTPPESGHSPHLPRSAEYHIDFDVVEWIGITILRITRPLEHAFGLGGSGLIRRLGHRGSHQQQEQYDPCLNPAQWSAEMP